MDHLKCNPQQRLTCLSPITSYCSVLLCDRQLEHSLWTSLTHLIAMQLEGHQSMNSGTNINY